MEVFESYNKGDDVCHEVLGGTMVVGMSSCDNWSRDQVGLLYGC